jgi:lysophospholipase L1-like esterase/pimeloyl-ACP methyl ester carboxylesterase
MKNIIILSIVCLIYTTAASAQNNKRYKELIFSSIDSIKDIPYNQGLDLNGKLITNLVDVFLPPKEDTCKKRPLLIFVHGGGFQNNTKVSIYGGQICRTFTKAGYVTASIDYRLGIAKPKTDTGYFEALYRGVQDARSAIRYFKLHADLYGIDSSQVFMVGGSAGGKIAMHAAYLNQSEVPSFIDVSKLGLLDDSSNAGASGQAAAVINCWGAMVDYRWINKGDVPLFNTAGLADKTVPFDSSFSYHGFKYGAYILYQRCLSLGIPTAFRGFEAAGHTLDNNSVKLDSSIQEMQAWLYTQLAIHQRKNKEGVLRWEKEMKQFDSLNKLEPNNTNTVLFVGSSTIKKWLHLKEDLKNKDIINRGFGGSNLSELAYYLPRVVYPHNPKAIFIYVSNDITGSDLDKTPIQVTELAKYITKELRAHYPSIPIVWFQIFTNEKRWAVWSQVQEANAMIKNYCANNTNMYFIEAANYFIGDNGLPIAMYYEKDQLHFNELGYQFWAKHIRKQVKKIIKKAS